LHGAVQLRASVATARLRARGLLAPRASARTGIPRRTHTSQMGRSHLLLVPPSRRAWRRSPAPDTPAPPSPAPPRARCVPGGLPGNPIAQTLNRQKSNAFSQPSGRPLPSRLSPRTASSRSAALHVGPLASGVREGSPRARSLLSLSPPAAFTIPPLLIRIGVLKYYPPTPHLHSQDDTYKCGMYPFIAGRCTGARDLSATVPVTRVAVACPDAACASFCSAEVGARHTFVSLNPLPPPAPRPPQPPHKKKQ